MSTPASIASKNSPTPKAADPIKGTAAAPPAKEEALQIPTSPTGIIDMDVFSQIRDMDDDEEEDEGSGGEGGHEFSKSIVWGFFEQADTTFEQMQEAIIAHDLPNLSSLGHFLKGSSAALGIIKVQASCEKMQHYGNMRDEETGEDLDKDEALNRIKGLLADCKRDYKVAEGWLKRLYEAE